MIKKFVKVWFMAFLLLAGCSSTYLRDSSNVSVLKKKYDKILVVAHTKDKIAG